MIAHLLDPARDLDLVTILARTDDRSVLPQCHAAELQWFIGQLLQHAD